MAAERSSTKEPSKKRLKKRKRYEVEIQDTLKTDSDEDLFVTQTPLKKKKKKKHQQEEEEYAEQSGRDGDKAEAAENSREHKKLKKKRKHKLEEAAKVQDTDVEKVSGCEREVGFNEIAKSDKEMKADNTIVWSVENVQRLLHRLLMVLPSDDKSRYSTRVDKLDWKKIQFGKFSAMDCKLQWKYLEKRSRKHRILAELVKEIADSINENDSFPEPPPRTKTRVSSKSRKSSLVPVCPKPFVLYSQVKLPALIEKYKLKYVDALKKCRKKWIKLKDETKMKWIKKALSCFDQYTREVQKYNQLVPDYKPKPLLNKKEQALNDRWNGKPKKPPMVLSEAWIEKFFVPFCFASSNQATKGGYKTFICVLMKQMSDIPYRERFKELSNKWKSLTDNERAEYCYFAQESLNRYKEDLQNYYATLSPEERKQLREEERILKKHTVQSLKKNQQFKITDFIKCDHGEDAESKYEMIENFHDRERNSDIKKQDEFLVEKQKYQINSGEKARGKDDQKDQTDSTWMTTKQKKKNKLKKQNSDKEMLDEIDRKYHLPKSCWHEVQVDEDEEDDDDDDKLHLEF